MRVIGDNSDGFRNEINIEKSLNFKLYEEVNPNLRHFLDDVFKGYSLKGKRIHAIRCNINVKPDFYLHIDGIPKEVYVSIKKGGGNSIHQESLGTFVSFLIKNKADAEVINSLKLFHYGDETTNNTGKVRYKASEFSKLHPEVVECLNKYFSDDDVRNKLIERFVFKGNIDNAPEADYLYHGTASNGVWASKKEIMEYIKTLSAKISAVCIGPLTYQVWNRNLSFKPNGEKKRQQMQIKWGQLENMLLEITSRRKQFVQFGKYEGDLDERASVIMFNRNPENSIFSDYLSSINMTPESTLLIRVTTKQLSKLSNQKVMTRADVYAIEILDNDILELLEENEFYLDEDILSDYSESYRFIEQSGISIKRHDSDSYQIIKLTPNSFAQLFSSYELGFAASLFCKKQDELEKNRELMNGWKTNAEKVQCEFPNFDISEVSLVNSLELCKQLKSYAIETIKCRIDSDVKIQQIIFNGLYIYEEPYTAFYLMKDNKIIDLTYIPYSITTGSGRSHGDYSLVLKPKSSGVMMTI